LFFVSNLVISNHQIIDKQTKKERFAHKDYWLTELGFALAIMDFAAGGKIFLGLTMQKLLV